MKVGRRLAIKFMNAAKFVLTFEAPADAAAVVSEPVDQGMLLNLAAVVAEATTAFENYDHTKALELAESFFWGFTDDYLELVKERAYGQGEFTVAEQTSAVLALRKALIVLSRLFAPFLPYATEEVWSWWQSAAGSVHLAAWPTAQELADGLDQANEPLLTLAADALHQLRKAKSDAKASMKADVQSATIEVPAEAEKSVNLLLADLRAAGRIQELKVAVGSELAMKDIVLAPTVEEQ